MSELPFTRNSARGDNVSWISQIFDADAAQNGRVVRRSRQDVNKYSSIDELIETTKEHSYHVIETGGQVVILCHKGQIVIHA